MPPTSAPLQRKIYRPLFNLCEGNRALSRIPYADSGSHRWRINCIEKLRTRQPEYTVTGGQTEDTVLTNSAHIFLRCIAACLFCCVALPSSAQTSRFEAGYLTAPRVEIGPAEAYELVFRVNTSGDIQFVLETASAPATTALTSGTFDSASQLLQLDEVVISDSESYAVTLALVSQTPEVIFRLASATLLEPESEFDIQATMALPQLNCTNSACHDVTPGTSRINLHTGTLAELAARLVDQPSGSPSCASEKLIDSINPENSLLLKLISEGSGEQCIAKMPFGKQGVADEYYPEFEQWVSQLIAAYIPDSSDDSDEDSFIQALDGFTALRRAKYILHGGAIEDAEYEQALTSSGELDMDGYRAVLESWFDTPAFKRKMLSFLSTAFQQNYRGPIYPNYFEMLGVTWGQDFCTVRPEGLYKHDAMERTLTEIVPRTAFRLIENDLDFRELFTTDEIVINSIGLFAMALGDRKPPSYDRISDGYNLCQYEGLSLNDFNDWRVVQLLPSDSPADFVPKSLSYVNSLRSIPDGGNFSVKANRKGACNSFAFLANWPTNVSNQYRLNASQCMIASLGLIFEAGDSTQPNRVEDLDTSHVDTTTDCYGCHQHLDPMTNVFRGQYNLKHQILDYIQPENRGDFSFQGFSQEVTTMDDFQLALASHPNFAMGVARKLCQWATSQACSSDDPHLQSVVADFTSSGHKFKQLVLSLFTSPLLTTLDQSGEFAETGSLISSSRAQHICLSLEARMEQQLATDRFETTEPDPKVCESSYYAREATKSVPTDLFQRGYAEFIQASDINLITPKLVEPLCDAIRNPVLQAFDGFYSQRSAETLDGFTKYLLGVPTASPTYEASRQSLETLYNVARAPQCSSSSALSASLEGDQSCGLNLDHTAAMQFVFRNVCLAPATTAIGF